jgi:hypothetical protein
LQGTLSDQSDQPRAVEDGTIKGPVRAVLAAT